MGRKYTSSYKVHPESGRNNRTPLLKKRNNKDNRLNWTENILKHSKRQNRNKTNHRKQLFRYNKRNTSEVRCKQ